jgi:pimeloyl-ACP methyl ester carboxylesterase
MEIGKRCIPLRSIGTGWMWILCVLLVTSLLCPRAANAHGQLDDYDRDAAILNDGLGRILNYEVVKPPGYQGLSQPLPLTIFLHGSTDGRTTKRARLSQTMADLLRATQGDNFERHAYCLIRCLPDERTAFEQSSQAENLAYSSFLLVPQIPETSAASSWSGNFDLLDGLISQTIANYEVDASRIYVVGFSDGGFGTYSMMYRHPDWFAAGVPIAGGASASIAEAIQHIPTWIFHGNVDGTVSPANATNMYNALAAAGGSPNLTIFPGIGHDSFAPAFRDVNNVFFPWLFSQSQVPEPATWSLFVLSLGLSGQRMRRATRLPRFLPPSGRRAS